MNYLVGYLRSYTILFLLIFLSSPPNTLQHTPYAQNTLAYSLCPGLARCILTLPAFASIQNAFPPPFLTKSFPLLRTHVPMCLGQLSLNFLTHNPISLL